jgi:uncharacterized membrane protein YhhN
VTFFGFSAGFTFIFIPGISEEVFFDSFLRGAMNLVNFINQSNVTDRILYTLYIISSLLFLSLLIPFHPYPFSFVLKSIPMLSLFIIVIRNVKTTQGILFSLGIASCLGGDITLDIDRTRFFMVGLIFFLIGHLFYIGVFLKAFKYDRKNFLYALPILIVSVVLWILFSTIPLAQRIPVLVYLCVISVMTTLSSFTQFSTKLVFWGAVLFMTSDIIIAINKFFHPIPNSTLYNIGIYLVAQLLLAVSFISTYKNKTMSTK